VCTSRKLAATTISAALLLQLRNLVHHVALQHRRVVPVGIFEGRGHDVLGHAVQPVGQLATPGWPPSGQPLVAPPTQQQRLCTQRLVERELAELWAVLDQADPAAAAEALVAGRVLDDSVKETLSLTTIFPTSGSPLVVLSVTTTASVRSSAVRLVVRIGVLSLIPRLV
jgi:hypothetical protein